MVKSSRDRRTEFDDEPDLSAGIPVAPPVQGPLSIVVPIRLSPDTWQQLHDAAKARGKRGASAVARECIEAQLEQRVEEQPTPSVIAQQLQQVISELAELKAAHAKLTERIGALLEERVSPRRPDNWMFELPSVRPQPYDASTAFAQQFLAGLQVNVPDHSDTMFTDIGKVIVTRAVEDVVERMNISLKEEHDAGGPRIVLQIGEDTKPDE